MMMMMIRCSDDDDNANAGSHLDQCDLRPRCQDEPCDQRQQEASTPGKTNIVEVWKQLFLRL